MRRVLLVPLLIFGLAVPGFAGEAEVKSAQTVVESQLKAFQAGDGALAYSFASPGIQQMFPTPDVFMSMVQNAYQPVFKPQSFAFGEARELSATSIMQKVMLVGPDGKDYEALYQLERQPDGKYRITGVSLRAANSLST